jgi:hypothetical protein
VKPIAVIECSLKSPNWLTGGDEGAGHMCFDFDRTQAAEVLRLWAVGQTTFTFVAIEGAPDSDRLRELFAGAKL